MPSGSCYCAQTTPTWAGACRGRVGAGLLPHLANRRQRSPARPPEGAVLARSASAALLPRGRGRSAALGADAAPTRPTSGTLTPATRSRARSSCAQPVSGRGPALVTGGCGPGAGGRGRGLPSSGPELARSEQPPASRRGASSPAPAGEQGKGAGDRGRLGAERGRGRPGRRPPPRGGCAALAVSPPGAGARARDPGRTPGGRAPRDGLLGPRGARVTPVAGSARSARRRARGPRTCGGEKSRPGLRSSCQRFSPPQGPGTLRRPARVRRGRRSLCRRPARSPGHRLLGGSSLGNRPSFPSCRRYVGDT